MRAVPLPCETWISPTHGGSLRGSESASDLDLVKGAGEGGAPQWGFYVQPVLALGSRLALVMRYEHFAAAGPPPQVNIMTGGFALRLLPTAVLKAEYQVVDRHTEVAPAGFRASLAVLF